MNKKQEIVKRYLDGDSQRSISKKLKASRNTVRKYIEAFEKSRQQDVRKLPIPENMISAPSYKTRINPKRVLTKEIQKLLQQYIAENQWKKQHYMAKQQMKIIDMHEALLDKGYNISYTTVRNYVNKEITKKNEVFIRKYCEPGAEIEFVRRKAFSTAYKFQNIKEANQHLITVLGILNQRFHHEHRIKHVDLMKKKKQAVGTTSVQPFDAAELMECRVDKYSTVVLKQDHYSVPEGHVGKYIRAKVGAEHIRLFIDGECVAKHFRNWGLHQWEMDIYHYLQTFEKKKGAMIQSQCLKQAPTHIKNIYHQYYIGKEKEFIALLHYIKENNNLQDVLKAIHQLKKVRSNYVSLDRIQFICDQQEEEPMVDERDDITK